jgi:predicted dehydrogenase
VRVLVVGYGSAGARHAQLLVDMGHDVVAYDADVRAAERERHYRQGFFGQQEEDAAWAWTTARGEGFDAAVIATPATEHLAGVCRAVQAGLPVLVEKPVAASADHLSLFEALARDYPAHVAQVGYQLRCHEGPRALRDSMRGGAVGRVLASRLYTGSHLEAWGGRRSSYADALLECSHELDGARWLFGDLALLAAGVSATGGTWEVLLGSSCGPVSVHMSTEERVYRRRWEVVGEDGVLTWDSVEGRVWLERRGAVDTLLRHDHLAANLAAYREQLARFVAAARVGPPPCTLREGLATLHLCQRAREAAKHPQNGGAVAVSA